MGCMTTSEELGRPIDTGRAASIVAVYATALVVATWLFLNTGSQVLPGVLVWIGWSLYPGLAAFVAIRAQQEWAVTLIATLTPSLILTLFQDWDSGGPASYLVPMAAAAGVFVGIWVARAFMRRGGRRWSVAGFIAGGLSGVVVTIIVAFPSLLFVSTGGSPRS